jgi:hypothetical protein
VRCSATLHRSQADWLDPSAADFVAIIGLEAAKRFPGHFRHRLRQVWRQTCFLVIWRLVARDCRLPRGWRSLRRGRRFLAAQGPCSWSPGCLACSCSPSRGYRASKLQLGSPSASSFQRNSALAWSSCEPALIFAPSLPLFGALPARLCLWFAAQTYFVDDGCLILSAGRPFPSWSSTLFGPASPFLSVGRRSP